MHCKDVREGKMRELNADDWSFLDSILGMGKDLGVYTVPGDGMIDYVSVFKTLKGYSGWVVLEAEHRRRSPVRTRRRTRPARSSTAVAWPRSTRPHPR